MGINALQSDTVARGWSPEAARLLLQKYGVITRNYSVPSLMEAITNALQSDTVTRDGLPEAARLLLQEYGVLRSAHNGRYYQCLAERRCSTRWVAGGGSPV